MLCILYVRYLAVPADSLLNPMSSISSTVLSFNTYLRGVAQLSQILLPETYKARRVRPRGVVVSVGALSSVSEVVARR